MTPEFQIPQDKNEFKAEGKKGGRKEGRVKWMTFFIK
jgi:hypothetical protein